MEVDESGVCSHVRTFEHPVHRPRFVLLPMAHVAEPAFFEDVTARVRRCDLAVVEGIVGKSHHHAKTVGSVYDLIDRFDHLGLVVEKIDFRASSIPLVRPDMTGAAFDRNWKRSPIRHRLLLRAAMVPFHLAFMRRQITRRGTCGPPQGTYRRWGYRSTGSERLTVFSFDAE
jgi:hypothetical protein